MYRRYLGFSPSPLWTIIILATLMFILTAWIPVIPRAFFLLGLSKSTFTSHPWSIVTNLFLHAGFGHLFANMLTLYFFGSYLARLLGWDKLLFIYFGGGILGNIFYLLSPFTSALSVAVGASGAIFALGGTLVMLRPRLQVYIFPFPVPIPLWISVIGGFLIVTFFPNVASEAHLGGLLFGLVVGYFLKGQYRFMGW